MRVERAAEGGRNSEVGEEPLVWAGILNIGIDMGIAWIWVRGLWEDRMYIQPLQTPQSALLLSLDMGWMC